MQLVLGGGNIIALGLMILAPFALLYAWFQYSERLRKDVFPIRNRCTLISLTLVSLTLALWPLVFAFIPKDYTASVRYGDTWINFVIMPICVIASILSLFGRARTTAPIVITCIGTVVFWALSFPGD